MIELSKEELKNLPEEDALLFESFKNEQDIKMFANSKVGKLIIKTLQADAGMIIMQMQGGDKSHEEFIRLGAKLNILMTLLRVFTNAESRAAAIEETLQSALVE